MISSSIPSKVYGTDPMKDLGGGVFGMYTGDGNQDGLVTSTDFNVFNPKFTSAASGYEYSDWNLDGLVTSTSSTFLIQILRQLNKHLYPSKTSSNTGLGKLLKTEDLNNRIQ